MATENSFSTRLCELLDRTLIGTKEMIHCVRRMFKCYDAFDNLNDQNFHNIYCGSMAEGLFNLFSDSDQMVVLKNVVVAEYNELLYIDCNKTQFRMIYDTHHRGSVLLELVHYVDGFSHILFETTHVYRGKSLISSKLFLNKYLSMCPCFFENGPCVTIMPTSNLSRDVCVSFKCNEWPRIAQEFIHRRRIFGWPHPAVLAHIITNGCHCVPIGDQMSEISWLQWRISFASAEVKLVHTFSHVEMKVYALLKIVHNDLLHKILDDSDGKSLICSYFLKTIMFHAKENSPLSVWTDDNMLNCFFFCFDFLIESVEKGFLSHYIIPANNLFRKRIYGQNRQILLQYLYTLRQQGVGILHECPTLHPLLGGVYLHAPFSMTPTERECLYDTLLQTLPHYDMSERTRSLLHVIHCLYSHYTSMDDGVMHLFLSFLLTLLIYTSSELFASTNESTLDNRTIYHRRRMCRHYLLSITQLDVSRGWLALATYHYLTGQYRLAYSIFQHVMQAIKPWTRIDGELANPDAYIRNVCGHGIPLLTKMKRSFSCTYFAHIKYCKLYPEEIFPEVQQEMVEIKPQVYASFLTFLCCHQMSDRSGQHSALSDLLALQHDDLQGLKSRNVYRFLLYHLIGICYEMVGDYRNAKINYLASAEQEHEWAPVARQRAANLRQFSKGLH